MSFPIKNTRSTAALEAKAVQSYIYIKQRDFSAHHVEN